MAKKTLRELIETTDECIVAPCVYEEHVAVVGKGLTIDGDGPGVTELRSSGDLPALEIISCYGVGVDAIDLDAARERGIVVTTTPDVLTDDVAEMALALILASVREIFVGDRFVRSGKWLEGEKPVAQRVGGKRLGILGLGRAGRAVAHRAKAFNMEIAYSDQNPIPDVAYPFFADAETLATTITSGRASRLLVARRRSLSISSLMLVSFSM